METDKIRVIKYKYESRRHSDHLIDHVFKYISTVTSLLFIPDSSEPAIYLDDGHSVSSGPGIVIKPDGVFCQKGSESGGRVRIIDYDPIDLLAQRLSIIATLGPYASDTHSPGIDTPLISAVIRDFLDAVRESGLAGEDQAAIDLWPGKAKFAVSLTHDIDIIRRSVPGSVRLAFNRHLPGGFAALVDSINSAAGITANPYDDIPRWIELEKEWGQSSTFFAFCGERSHKFDPVYKLSKLERQIEMIKRKGFELALHTGVESYRGNGISLSKRQMENISGMEIRGIRPHYLSASFPEYWQAARDASFAYSSSLGYDNRIGHFAGVDLPIIPFDKRNDKAIDIVEFPIAMMDCGLIGNDRADSVDADKRGVELIESASRSGGLIVMDWHQRTFYNRDYPGWVSLFVRMAELARERGACFVRLDEMAGRVMGRFRNRS